MYIVEQLAQSAVRLPSDSRARGSSLAVGNNFYIVK